MPALRRGRRQGRHRHQQCRRVKLDFARHAALRASGHIRALLDGILAAFLSKADQRSWSVPRLNRSCTSIYSISDPSLVFSEIMGTCNQQRLLSSSRALTNRCHQGLRGSEPCCWPVFGPPDVRRPKRPKTIHFCQPSGPHLRHLPAIHQGKGFTQ